MINPLRDMVVVSEIRKAKESEGGIILTQEDKSETKYAMVIAIGPECNSVEQGQTVLPDWSKGNVMQYKQHALVVLKETDILAVVES